jgi:hypothetical protein
MALRKAAQEPQFEQVQEATEMTMDTTVEAMNDAREEAAAPTPAAVPAVRQSTAVGNVNDIAAQAKAFQRELDEMKGAADFSFGNYAVFKASNGEISQTGKEDTSLGRWAKIRLLAWDDHHEITPGSQDKGSKDFVAYSKDGQVIDSVIGDEMKKWVGKSVAEYINYLRETEGFEKAGSKRYVDLSCALLATDSGDGPIGTVVQVTLSPSSISSFSKYQQALKDQARCAAMALPGFSVPEDPFTLFLVREVVSSGSNKWSKINFFSNLPNKL